MEEPNPLENMDRIQAPSGFESRVLAELAIRKRRFVRRRRAWRFSLAGATAVVLVGIVSLNVFVLKRQTPAQRLQNQVPGEIIPIIEPVDYSGEVRSTSREPQTIYILEQVTEAANTQFKY